MYRPPHGPDNARKPRIVVEVSDGLDGDHADLVRLSGGQIADCGRIVIADHMGRRDGYPRQHREGAAAVATVDDRASVGWFSDPIHA
jgi:hypothetical protein